MIVYFSPSRCGFYDQDSSIRPEDAVEVTLDAYHALLDAQAAGAVIGVDDKGQPVARPKPRRPWMSKRRRRACFVTSC